MKSNGLYKKDIDEQGAIIDELQYKISLSMCK